MSEAKIFLAEKRGRTESPSHRGLHTFNFGKFRDANHEPFFALTALNDETLAAGHTIDFKVSSNCLAIVIPLIGGIERQINNDGQQFLEVGESELIPVVEDSALQFRNPYDTEAVNYLTIWLSSKAKYASAEKSIFNLDKNKNSLVKIFSFPDVSIYLGKFGGRIDTEFTPEPKTKGLFAFVIEGAVEFDNCLLQQRDGLVIWNKTKVKFESLSGETIVMLIEL